MSSLTFESSSLENYTTIGLKILPAMFELKLAKPHGYSKKKKLPNYRMIKHSIYLTNKHFGLDWVYFS